MAKVQGFVLEGEGLASTMSKVELFKDQCLVYIRCFAQRKRELRLRQSLGCEDAWHVGEDVVNER